MSEWMDDSNIVNGWVNKQKKGSDPWEKTGSVSRSLIERMDERVS